MQYVASRTLVELELENERLAPALTRLLSTPNDFQYIFAVRSLGLLGPRAAPAVGKLIQDLEPVTGRQFSGGGRVDGRSFFPDIITTLGNIGPPARAALPLLHEAKSYFQGGGAEYAFRKISGTLDEPVPEQTPTQSIPVVQHDVKPRYDGKTFDEWRSIVQYERKPERLAEAVRAFSRLTDERHPEKTADALFEIMQRFGIEDDTSKRELTQAVETAIQKLQPETLATALIKQLKTGVWRQLAFQVLSSNCFSVKGVSTSLS